MCDINNCIVGYYLYEIYFSEDRQYKGDHPSRGYPKYININDIKGSPYTEIFLIAQICQTHRQIVYSFYNEIVFGLFYGWYCINPQKPFDIHSPDSVKQGNPYYLDEDGKFYRY